MSKEGHIPGAKGPNPGKEKFRKVDKNIQDLMENWEKCEMAVMVSAKTTRAFYLALVKEGFSEKQALEIVANRGPFGK